MKKIILTAIILLSITKVLFAQYTIPSTLFGINGWMNNQIGDATNVYDCKGLSSTYSASPVLCNLGGDVDNTIMAPSCSSKVKNLYVNVIRYGGHACDVNAPTYDQYVNEIDRIRSMGAEPIIQIPYNDGAYSSTDASNLLTYLNVTLGKRIKYVEIGNEPDMYQGYISAMNKAHYIATYFTSYASALKAVDNTIKIIGPSFSAYDPTVYATLLGSGTDNIVGTDGTNYYLDIVDIHRYPFNGSASQDRAHIINDPANINGGNSTNNFASVLTNTTSTGLLDYISAANASRSSSPLQFSVSEMNIDYKNPSSNGVGDYGTNSFIAGQWMADMYSTITDKANATGVDVAFVCPWSIHESSGNASTYDLGILNGSTPCSVAGERSTYEHLAMMGQYFKGGLSKGTNNSIGNVKQLGSVLSNGDYVIMLLNQDANTSYSYTINTGSVTTGSGTLVATMYMSHVNHAYTYTAGIAPKTTHLVFLDCSGNFLKTLKYDETDASNHAAPSTLTGTGALPVSLTMSSINTGCTSSTSIGSATVTASGGTGSYTYTWSPSGGNSSTASSLAAGTYTVSVSSGTVCNAAMTSIVTISAASPTISINPTNANSCTGSAATFTATGGGGTSPYTYSWSPGGATTNTVSIPVPGTNTATTYTVKVTDAHGCVNTALATNYGGHSVSFTPASYTTGTCCGFTVTATYIPGASYLWKAGTTTLSTSPTLANTFGSPGTYSVIVTPGNLDPCSTFTTTYIVTSNSQTCTCGQGPPPRMANVNSPSSSFEISAIQSVIPNPTGNTTIIAYSLSNYITKAEILISNIFGQQVSLYPLDVHASNIELDCSVMKDGIYFSTLFVDGKAISTKKIMVAK